MPYSSMTDVRRLARRLRYALREVPALRHRLAMREQLRALREEHPGVAEDLSGLSRPDGRRVLIVTLSDNVEEAKLQALLAKALQLGGARVRLLTMRSAPRARAVYKALGVRDLVYTEDFVTDGAREGFQVADRLLAAEPTVRDLVAYEHEGVRIGRQALATVVRSQLEPRVDLSDAATREALRTNLAQAVEGIGRSLATLDATRPDIILLLERGYVSFASLFDVALQRGIPVVQFQAAHRDDALQLKRYHLAIRDSHPRSLDERTWRRLSDGGWNDERERILADELRGRAQGKWFMARRLTHSTGRRGSAELRRQLGLDTDRPVVAVFSHVLWDASMFYGDDLYPDQGVWFAETVRLAAETDDVQWLIKLHPALFWKIRMSGAASEPSELRMIREVVGTLPEHMRLLRPDDDVDNSDLFPLLHAGVTIRGTVGFELPQLGTPVLTAGTSDYTGRGFTVDSASVAEYEAKIRSIASLARLRDERISIAKLYAYGIFCVRPWLFRSFAQEFLPVDEAGDTLEHKIRFRVRTARELEQAEDLRAFAAWVLDSDDADFVHRDLVDHALSHRA